MANQTKAQLIEELEAVKAELAEAIAEQRNMIAQEDVDAAVKTAIDAYRTKVDAWIGDERQKAFEAGRASATPAARPGRTPAQMMDARERSAMLAWWKESGMSQKNHKWEEIYSAWKQAS